MRKKQKMTEGNGQNRQLDVLTAIHDQIAGLRIETNQRFESLERTMLYGFAGVRRELDEVKGEIKLVNGRLDNLIELSGGSWRNHEDRLRSLELRVDRLDRRPRRRAPKREE